MVAVELLLELAARDVPDLDLLVVTAGDQGGAVGAEDESDRALRVGLELLVAFVRWPMSQMMTFSWSPALATRLPSGLKATALTRLVPALSGAPTCSPVDVSHRRTVPSPLALAISLPSPE